MPTSAFLARDAKLSRSLEKAFGESFTFTAYTAAADVNLPRVADGTKLPLTLVGIWQSAGMSEFPIARGSNPDDEATQLAMQYPSVSVDRTLLTTFIPKRGDRCLRAIDGSIYEVQKALPNDRGNRTIIFLSARMKP